MQHLTFFPPCVKANFDAPEPVQAANAGILGGHNITFINEKAQQTYRNNDSTNDINAAPDETANTHFVLLKKIADQYTGYNDEMKKDFSVFYDSLLATVQKSRPVFYL